MSLTFRQIYYRFLKIFVYDIKVQSIYAWNIYCTSGTGEMLYHIQLKVMLNGWWFDAISPQRYPALQNIHSIPSDGKVYLVNVIYMQIFFHARPLRSQ